MPNAVCLRTVASGSRFLLAAGGALLLPVCAPAQGSAAAAPQVVILPFVLAGAPAAAPNPGVTACPAGLTLDTKDVPEADQSAVVSVVAAELQTRLSKNATAQVVVPGAAVPAGALLLTGCITKMDEGNATKRVIGAGMGASVLDAQVQISRMVDGKPTVLATFTKESKGRNFGVGSGMLINAMRAKRTSLQGDAANLADQIAREYGKREASLKQPQ